MSSRGEARRPPVARRVTPSELLLRVPSFLLRRRFLCREERRFSFLACISTTCRKHGGAGGGGQDLVLQERTRPPELQPGEGGRDRRRLGDPLRPRPKGGEGWALPLPPAVPSGKPDPTRTRSAEQKTIGREKHLWEQIPSS